MGQLETIAPIFLLLGATFVVAYLMPYVMGKWDDRNVRRTIKKNSQSPGAMPRRWKCQCNAMLISHGCGACMVLNDAGVEAWCPNCLEHPKDPIACQ